MQWWIANISAPAHKLAAALRDSSMLARHDGMQARGESDEFKKIISRAEQEHHQVGSPHRHPQSPKYMRASKRVRIWRRRVLLRKGVRLHEKMGEDAAHASLAILDEFGMIVAWHDHGRSTANDDVLLNHVSRFYIRTDIEHQLPTQELNAAIVNRGVSTHGWRRHADGRVFWGVTRITPICLRDGRLQGYAHVTREASSADVVTGVDLAHPAPM